MWNLLTRRYVKEVVRPQLASYMLRHPRSSVLWQDLAELDDDSEDAMARKRKKRRIQALGIERGEFGCKFVLQALACLLGFNARVHHYRGRLRNEPVHIDDILGGDIDFPTAVAGPTVDLFDDMGIKYMSLVTRHVSD